MRCLNLGGSGLILYALRSYCRVYHIVIVIDRVVRLTISCYVNSSIPYVISIACIGKIIMRIIVFIRRTVNFLSVFIVILSIMRANIICNSIVGIYLLLVSPGCWLTVCEWSIPNRIVCTVIVSIRWMHNIMGFSDINTLNTSV